MYLVIDTEGSGLFKFKDDAGNPVPADAEGQPRLAAICMLSVDADLQLTATEKFIIKPDGWKMDPGATAVNGLTDEFLQANGVPVAGALDRYEALVKEGRTVCAHNAQHDTKQLRAELRRAGRSDLFEETKQICTMRALTDVCKIPPNGGRGGYKWPKLSEACVFFHLDQFGDHSAENDALACLELLRKMRDLGILRDGAVHFAKKGKAPA
jgi:DNA polymerase III subunit epsilon